MIMVDHKYLIWMLICLRQVKPAIGEVPAVKAAVDQLLGAGRYDAGMDEEFNGRGRELDVQVWLWPAKDGRELPPRGRSKEGGNWEPPPDSQLPGRPADAGPPASDVRAPEPAGHIEAYRGQRPSKPNPAGWCDRFQLGAFTFLQPVKPRGGGTLLWPRSVRPRACASLHAAV